MVAFIGDGNWSIKLKSFFISRVTEGNYERNLSDFDEMQHEAASDRNLGLLHDISVRIVDGSRK